jgi:hypothetical protein
MTGSTPQWGAPPRQKLRPWHIILIVLGGTALFGIGLWQVLVWALGPMIATGDDFMRAMGARDFERAYALAEPALQRELGHPIRMGILASPEPFSEWSWSQRSVRNGAGLLAGTVLYPEGRSGSVTMHLSQIDGQWRVESFRFESPR